MTEQVGLQRLTSKLLRAAKFVWALALLIWGLALLAIGAFFAAGVFLGVVGL